MIVVKRIYHTYCQALEVSLRSSVLVVMPLPSTENQARNHPGAQRGSPQLRQFAVDKFFTRGGGYVSVRDIADLSTIGFSNEAKWGTRLASEMCGRYMAKCSQHLQTSLDKDIAPMLNVVMDASRLAKREVASKCC